MTKRMLIDASHPEETRVVVLDGNRLDEFDFETASKKQLKGNIYLAKITRVEPSLQAAFVEYGGNRHGFLAFSEIHSDYYKIPVADREALQREESQASGARGRSGGDGVSDDMSDPFGDPRDEDDSNDGGRRRSRAASADDNDDDDGGRIETVGGDDIDEAAQTGPTRPRRSYKIQEVIKRRQIMLVQVTKEERGNKGAALTTYLSLAGRYCVLMPNTPRGGGISRKIVSPKDRKRLKAILDDLMIPEGMAVILRTAGLERTKAEIRRDLDYLLRLWDNIRETTLQSTAPTLIYEEANLIKRAERDLYAKDIDDIQVAGEDGYRTAKDFMKMLMPSHARKVKPYRDTHIPLFHRYQVESQIDSMHSPTVALKSGGYVVINPTEALVAIDVNSGRSTRERNIEETAYKTNLEAADEVARQLRLRDLAGLIVIDFIDMEDDRHNLAVERRLKDAMRQDRARIQLGRISAFGLLELSRQRLRPSLTETHFETCPQCNGTGLARSLSSASLHLLRAIEEEGIRSRSAVVRIYAPTDVVLYVLNEKRAALTDIERRYAFSVILSRDDTLIPPNHRIDQIEARSPEDIARAEARAAAAAAEQRLLEKQEAQADADIPEDDIDDEPDIEESDSQEDTVAADEASTERDTETRADDDGSGEGKGRRKRRSRSRRRRRDDRPEDRAGDEDQSGDEGATGEVSADGDTQREEEAATEVRTVPITSGTVDAGQSSSAGSRSSETAADTAPVAEDADAGSSVIRPAGGWWARRRAAAQSAAFQSATSQPASQETASSSLSEDQLRTDISTLSDIDSSSETSADDDDIGETFPSSTGAYDDESEDEKSRRRRRRGKRGGRRRTGRRRDDEDTDLSAGDGDGQADNGEAEGAALSDVLPETGGLHSTEHAASAREDHEPASAAGTTAPVVSTTEDSGRDSVQVTAASVQEDQAATDQVAAEPTEPAAAEESTPAKRRAPRKPRSPATTAAPRSRARKAAPTEDGGPDTTAVADTSAATADVDGEAKPKRRRAPRKTAAKSGSAKAETAQAPDAGTADEVNEKPAPRKRATRSKAASETADEPKAKTPRKTTRTRSAAKKKAETGGADASASETASGLIAEVVPETGSQVDKPAAPAASEPAPAVDDQTDEKKARPRRGWWASTRS